MTEALKKQLNLESVWHSLGTISIWSERDSNPQPSDLYSSCIKKLGFNFKMFINDLFFYDIFRSAKTTSMFKLGKGRKGEDPIVVFNYEIWWEIIFATSVFENDKISVFFCGFHLLNSLDQIRNILFDWFQTDDKYGWFSDPH